MPPEAADAIEPAMPAATREILAAIAREVPEYARPLEGSFGRGVRTGVDEALRQFVALIRDPDAGRDAGREVYVGLGRGELSQGRTLDSLQAAYRVGARAAWRHVAAAAREAELGEDVMARLAESVFAYIDELSADSVEGYAQAQSELEGERERRRRELVALLVRDPAAETAEVRPAARAAGWAVPRSVAALACSESDLVRVARRVPGDTLACELEGVGCVLVPDPEGPRRAGEIGAALDGIPTAIGPAGDRTELGGSWSLARAAMRGVESGSIEGPAPVRAADRLTELLLIQGADLARLIAARRLRALEPLTPRARERMRETALAYVRERGNAAAMARAMHVHPQTARYRLARLRELIGEALDDPDARFELEIALRADRVAS